MAASNPAVDWKRLMRGKLLLEERIRELTTMLLPLYNSCNDRGRWDYRRMAAALNTAGLAQVLRGCDPARPSTEDKLQQVNNLISLYEHLAPALAYGGVHDAVLHLHTSSDQEWVCYEGSLATLRLVLEGCATTPAGMDPFSADSLVAVATALADYLEQVYEAGMSPARAQGVDHCLEALYSLLRYRGHPGAEAAKEEMWEVELPEWIFGLAQAPASAYGHEVEGRRDKGLDLFLASSVNVMRVLTSLAQAPGPPTDTMQRHGELLQQEGAFDALKALLQTACDLVYTQRFECTCGPTCQESGAALMRNIFAVVGYGSLWVHRTTLTELKEAGWEPVLQRIKDDTSYRGHYRTFFHRMATALLSRLARWKGRTDREAMQLGQELTELTISLSVPRDAIAGSQLPGNLPRDPSAAEMENRRSLGQRVGPDGQPVDLYEITMLAKSYTKFCAGCQREEAAMEAGTKLQECSACHRARYCSRECQVAHWPTHKPECKLYQRRQQQEEQQPGGAAGQPAAG